MGDQGDNQQGGKDNARLRRTGEVPELSIGLFKLYPSAGSLEWAWDWQGGLNENKGVVSLRYQSYENRVEFYPTTGDMMIITAIRTPIQPYHMWYCHNCEVNRRFMYYVNDEIGCVDCQRLKTGIGHGGVSKAQRQVTHNQRRKNLHLIGMSSVKRKMRKYRSSGDIN